MEVKISTNTDQVSHPNPGPFSASDLPMTPDGTIYHLAVKQEQIARDILLVGDPDRVPAIVGEHFSSVETDVFHRGLRTMTGEVKSTGQRVTVLTSGMGPSSLEVIVNELMELNEIDPGERIRRNMVDRLNIIRVGTCGVLQQETRLGIPIISSYAIGLDNSGLFYNFTPPDESCLQIEERVKMMLDQVMPKDSRFYGKIFPYAAKADPELLAAMVAAAQSMNLDYEIGLTVSSSGFHANQGRDNGRIPPSVPDIDLHLSKLDPGINGQKILNMEMESSYLFHFGAGHGYRCGTICAGLANRRLDTFLSDYKDSVHNATAIALKALGSMRGN